MATIKKRKNKNGTFSYEAMVRVKDGLPATYKRFPTRQEAKDWALQQEAQRRQGLYFPEQLKKKHTVSDLIIRYREHILPSNPKNLKDTLRHLEWWNSKIGGCTLNLVTPDLISQCRKELLEGNTPRGTKRTPATTNRYLAALSVAFSYGVRECGWITSNPTLRVSKFKEPQGRDRVLSLEESNRLLAACVNSSEELLLPFVILALTTGARKGELLGLTWSQVDLERGTIHLKDTKNGRPRALAIVEPALGLLKKLHNERTTINPNVFPSRTRFGRLSLRKPWERAIKEAELDAPLRMHDLRHCFSTWASESGASNVELQLATGHSSLSQLNRYCHPNAGVVRRLSNAVSDKIFKEAVEIPKETSI